MVTPAQDVYCRFVDEYQSKGDQQALQELIAEDFVDHTPAPGLPGTRDGVRTLFAMLRAAIPDMRAEIQQQVAEGDMVATYKYFVGTHDGGLFGVPATGKAITIRVMDFVRVGEGAITEHWNVVDMYGLMQQLGALG